MLESRLHHPKILLVEDLELYSNPILRWLANANYEAALAASFTDAIRHLDSHHYHLAVVDIRLVDQEQANIEGLKFLEEIEKRNLSTVMPTIVLTAYPNLEQIQKAYQQYKIAYYIQKKPSYKADLLNAIQDIFQRRLEINFDLGYDIHSHQILPELFSGIQWPGETPTPERALTEEIQDLFGKLFKNASSILVAKIKPGLSGASLVRVDPIWKVGGLGPPKVLKIDRRDKALIEEHNFENFVQHLLPHSSTQLSAAHSQHLGALLYSFMEEESKPFAEFDILYQEQEAAKITASLHTLFYNTCRYWYDRRERKHVNLQELYYEAFNLDTDKLVQRFQQVLPDYDPHEPGLKLPDSEEPIQNPLYWLEEHYNQCNYPVFTCITHGDLTGRNIMVDDNHKLWLIDFLRTYPSHILRDFVTLETDIKFRLAPLFDLAEFVKLEHTLLATELDANLRIDDQDFSPPAQKAGLVIGALRNFANTISLGAISKIHNRDEYLVSLLMTTLNVVRLRHIPNERKISAIRSAALICDTLDH